VFFDLAEIRLYQGRAHDAVAVLPHLLIATNLTHVGNTATFENDTLTGAPSAVPRCSVENRSGFL